MWFPMDGRDRFDVRGTPFIGCLDVRAGTPTHQQCYGGHSERETPGSIPNPEAKLLSADGTAGGTLWESRSSPDIKTPPWWSVMTPRGCFASPGGRRQTCGVNDERGSTGDRKKSGD